VGPRSTRVLGTTLIALSLVAVSCTPSDDDGAVETTTTVAAPEPITTTMTTEPAADASPAGGEARIFLLLGESLNPLIDRFGGLAAGDAHLAGALRPDWNAGALVPYLLAEMPTVDNGGLVESPDGTLTVTYQIRPEAVWADGTPISGDDFAFTYELITDPELAEALWIYPDDVYGWITPDSIEAGPKTFSYTLDRVTPWWEWLFEVVVPKHDVEGKDFLADFNDEAWVSGGPFIVEAWDATDRVLTLGRNDNYWLTDPESGERLPYLDRILAGEFRSEYLADLSDRLDPELHDGAAMYIEGAFAELIEAHGPEAFDTVEEMLRAVHRDRFLAGEEHTIEAGWLASSENWSDAATELLAEPGVDGAVLAGRFWDHLAFNLAPTRLEANEDSWNQYPKFRQAVAHALDREAIAADAFGPGAQSIESYLDVYSPTLAGQTWPEYDPDRAATLIDELCAELARDCEANPPTLRYTGSAPYHRWNLTDLLPTMLEPVGIRVEAEPTLMGAGQIVSEAWDTTSLGFGRDFGLADLSFVHDLWAADSVENVARWCTPDAPTEEEHCDQYQEIASELRSTVDSADARRLALEAEQILADDVAFIPFYVWPNYLFWRSDVLSGPGMVYEGPQLWNSAHWDRTDG
jgi:ABC-type transport system substrate-binding protein